MLRDDAFIVVQSFMVKDLHLKGNELLVYAVIHGFSITESQSFTGSLKYLMEWTGSTSKSNTIKILKSLIDKGLIEKEDVMVNGVKFCRYRATVVRKTNEGGTEIEPRWFENRTEGGSKIEPNNIEDNIADTKDNNKAIVEIVVSYLNEKTGKKFRPTDSVARLIRGRLKEGYTEEDFRKVIDTKTAQWLKDEKMKKYLQPSTLFAPSHFQNYLNEEGKKEEKPKWQIGTVL